MKVHFIAIGGAAMHNLAIALKIKGYEVTGSDDEFYEPSLSRLKTHGLLPGYTGWNPQILDESYQAVILGMHARADNPELLKARELGIRIYSYPEFLYEQTKNKKRVVIGGSHGKTSVTSMIMHVLRAAGLSFDFMVGAMIDGFDCMVNLEDKNTFAVFEGDEYLASPIDRRPKFHLYHPHVAVLTGIAWDHMNVFPTFESYTEQFALFLSTCEPGARVFYAAYDPELEKVMKNSHAEISALRYAEHKAKISGEKTSLLHHGLEIPVAVFGRHNMLNIEAARLVCNELGISDTIFYQHIGSFKGAAKRLETLYNDGRCIVLRDFAHSPSKLKATVNAVREQYKDYRLVAAMELHTFSSLNPAFLAEYKNTMLEADQALVYFNPQTLEHKKLPPIQPESLQKAFNQENLQVYTSDNDLRQALAGNISRDKTCYLLMSSGTFNGTDFKVLASSLAGL